MSDSIRLRKALRDAGSIAFALAATAVTLAATAVTASGQTTTLVSRTINGDQGNDYSGTWAMSADANTIAFWSTSSNLLGGNWSGHTDIFVRDRITDELTIASTSASGEFSNGACGPVGMSSDGRFVGFKSWASNLVASDVNGQADIFLRDRALGTIEIASLADDESLPNAESYEVGGRWISTDGRIVAFYSSASNLVAGDVIGKQDVFVRDRVAGTTVRLSQSAAGAEGDSHSSSASVSEDGAWVVFESHASNLVPGDTNGKFDVFLWERATGALTLISATAAGVQGDAESYSPMFSGDGQHVVFTSYATNLVPGDTNGQADVMLLDRATGAIQRVNVSSAGVEANAAGWGSRPSFDGRYVAFYSYASNLVAGDTNGIDDVFVRDTVAGTLERVSISTTGAQGNNTSQSAEISADGRHVLFQSYGSNLVAGDVNNDWDVFLRDRTGCSPTVASYCVSGLTTHGCSATMSGSGTPSGSAGSGFTLRADGVEGKKSGLIFYSTGGPLFMPWGGAAHSYVCAGFVTQRTDSLNSGGTSGGCDGVLQIDWNHFVATHTGALGTPFVGGETVWAQAWFRDPGTSPGSNLSNAVWFEVCP